VFRSINEAAAEAQPGDHVVIHAGVYRERVNPIRAGEEGAPIVYEAGPGEKVYLRASEVAPSKWVPVGGRVYGLDLGLVTFGVAAYQGHVDESLYGGFVPFHTQFNRNQPARPLGRWEEHLTRTLERQMAARDASGDPLRVEELTKAIGVTRAALGGLKEKGAPRPRTLGQVFLRGKPLIEVGTQRELGRIPGAWMVSDCGSDLLVHFPADVASPNEELVEIAVRHTVFSPRQRGLGHIHVRGLIVEHAANHFPTWGRNAWGQVGALSTRGGHHWLIEDCTVRYNRSLGIDCGSEGGIELIEDVVPGDGPGHQERDWSAAGYHLIRHNRIQDNGLCGIAGIGHHETRVICNVIERNNRAGHTSPYWEFAGIKFHFFFDGLIENNLIRDNEAHGIWLDNQWRGSRVRGNVVVNNLWSGINIEYGRGPLLVDHNVIAYTRQGSGIYGHDVADVTIAHNLLYANSHAGAWFAYATPRVAATDGCWDIQVVNNLILGNKVAAVGLPMDWGCAGNNVSDSNLLTGGGEYLDEGSGSRPPLFQITNRSHCGQIPGLTHGKTPQTREVVEKQFVDALRSAGIEAPDAAELERWHGHYLVSAELWRAATGCDQRSGIQIGVIRDGLHSRVVSWEFDFDDAVFGVETRPVEGCETDFNGETVGAGALPGPFQSLHRGRFHHTLWPRPGCPSGLLSS
jgi:hypothetical protein